MRTKCLNKALLVIGLVVVTCGFAMQASADTFGFSQATGFSVSDGDLISTNVGDAKNDIKWYQNASTPQPPTGYFNTIAWGASNNAGGEIFVDPVTGIVSNPREALSALKVIGLDGDVSTGDGGAFGDWESITTLYHQNNAISSSFYSLASAIIYSELTFTPPGFTDGNTVAITFEETRNRVPCGGPGETVCSDQFGFSGAGFVPITFINDGKKYRVAFQLANFVNSTLDSTNFPDLVVWTDEGVTSSLDVQMRLRQVVPEPTTLVLLGLGLLGLGFTKRRKE